MSRQQVDDARTNLDVSEATLASARHGVSWLGVACGHGGLVDVLFPENAWAYGSRCPSELRSLTRTLHQGGGGRFILSRKIVFFELGGASSREITKFGDPPRN